MVETISSDARRRRGPADRLPHMNLTGARDRLRKALEVAVIVLVGALAVLVVVGVGFRKAGASLVWYDEVASILLAWLTYYGAALAALHRAHIGMPTLVDRLSGVPRTIMVLVGEACVLTFFAVLAWAGVRVLSVLGGTTLVSLPSVPMSVAQSVIPIGAVLFIVAQLLTLPDVLRRPVSTAAQTEEEADA
jgi:TRAP-type C4-dicarboxylate transport system permease small subunit